MVLWTCSKNIQNKWFCTFFKKRYYYYYYYYYYKYDAFGAFSNRRSPLERSRKRSMGAFQEAFHRSVPGSVPWERSRKRSAGRQGHFSDELSRRLPGPWEYRNRIQHVEKRSIAPLLVQPTHKPPLTHGAFARAGRPAGPDTICALS